MNPTVKLLGTLEIVGGDGRAVDIGGSQPRIILAMLVAAEGQAVAVDALIDAIWEDSPPMSASGTLQTYISRLRRALGEVGATIVREPAGYRVALEHDSIDARCFEALADEGRRALDAGDLEDARARLIEADGLWRGPALLEVRDRARIAGIARRLEDRRLAAIEDRVAADLALGRHATVVAELAQLVGEHPLREGLWELLALARYRSGMQADALRAIAEARDTLVEELGVEPGAQLRELEQRILAQDPELAVALPATTEPVMSTVERASAGTRVLATASGVVGAGENSGLGTDDGRSSPAAPDLIGRRTELASLVRALEAAIDGRPGIAVVQGEAGVGKTRLVEELASEASCRGATVVWGRALESGAAPVYWPWLNVLRMLRSARPDLTSAALDQLLDVAETPAAKALGEGSHLLDGVLRLVESSAADRPLVVVLEDVQWADVESLELATHVVSGLTTGSVLFVLTLREGEEAGADGVLSLLSAASRRGGARLRLDGLDVDDTAALLAQVSGGVVDEAVAHLVHDRVEGNPFYAIELQRLLDAEGLADVADVAARAVPVGVRDVVGQRLARLPDPTLELLEIAAVAGREVDVELISAASGRALDTCLDDLEVALRHRLLAEAASGFGLRFSHALVREVVVDQLSALRRARTHLAIADALVELGRDEDAAEILAEHLWAAVPIGVGHRAAEAMDRASDVAIRRFAVGTARNLLERSLELRRATGSGPGADAAELDTLVRLVWVLWAQGGYGAGLLHYERATELARRLGRHEVELDMQRAEWASHAISCDLERARPVADRFRTRAEESDVAMIRLAGFSTWGIQCWHDGNLAESAEYLARARDERAAVETRADDLTVAAEFVLLSLLFELVVGELVGQLNDPESAYETVEASVDGNVPVAIIWTFAANAATCVGDLGRVERATRRILEAEAGEPLGLYGGQARMFRGAMLIACGRPDEGRPMFDSGLEHYRGVGIHTALALMLAAAASAEVIAGDIGRASARLADARAELERGERWPRPYVLLAEADVAEATGADPSEVMRLRREAEEVAASIGSAAAAQRARAARDGERWLVGDLTSG